MDQLSLPYRIALVALLVVAALWFTVLRPKDETAAPPPQAPGVTGLANDVSKAQGTAGAANASAASSEGAANAVGAEPAATPATSAAGAPASSAASPARAARPAKGAAKKTSAKTADDARDRSAPLLRALDARHAVVLLFWNRAGADDRAVRAAVGGVDRRGAKVRVEAASVADVGRYEAITRGVQVVESPTVLVIGPQHTARAITGYTTKAEIDQAVGDALRGAAK